jgi:hypothetical protein
MARKSTSITHLPNAARIFTVRGKRVILDSDLAELYDVPTKQLNQQVRRNPGRFPPDFAFRLSPDEWEVNRSQFVTGSEKHRDPRSLPFAFTEHGALMAAGVLNSKRAIEVSIFVVRTFVAMREVLAEGGELTRRLDELERALEGRLAKQDQAIAEIFAAIRALMKPTDNRQRPIGFVA